MARKVPRWVGYAWPHVRRALREPRYGVAVLLAGRSLWRQGGWRAVEHGIATSKPAINDYGAWVRMYDTLTRADLRAIRARIASLPPACVPAILIPIVNRSPSEIAALGRTIGALERQLEERWEAVIVVVTNEPPPSPRPQDIGLTGSDGRIRVVGVAATDRTGALNAGVDAITANAFLVLDPGDQLARHAVYRLAEELYANPGAALIYSDEDRLTPASGMARRPRRADPCFKPAWGLEQVLSAGGVGRVVCLARQFAERVGGFTADAGEATELDLVLRVSAGAHVGALRHIPEILVHRENVPKPLGMDAARAVDAHLNRLGRAAAVEPDITGSSLHVRYGLPDPPPSVTLVMPSRNAHELLRRTVESLLEQTDYPHLDLIVVDNGSDDAEALAYLDLLDKSSRARVLRREGPFNFAALVNAGVEAASGDLVALVNNDLVAKTADWLHELVSVVIQPGVGAVGARLWYPDGTLQHGGIVVGLGGVAGHAHKGLRPEVPGHCGHAVRRHEVSAVTGACLVMGRDLFLEMGGLDAEHLPVAFNDVDLCLRIQTAGLSVVWTPYAELVHVESATRGAEDTPEKVARFEAEIAVMKARWGSRLAEDPFYSPNLTLDREDFSLAWPRRTVLPWHDS